MPQDSLYILNGQVLNAQGDTLFRLDDSTLKAAETEMERVDARFDADESPSWSPLWIFAPFLFVIVVHFLVVYIKKAIIGGRKRRLLESKAIEFEAILQAHSPYYRKLDDVQKKIFLRRTLSFIADKTFHYVELKEEDRIPVLVSAVAIQITFGLENYLLDYFKDIYIMRTNYHFGLSHIPFEGHVNSNGIYLSWNNFVNAFSDYSDGSNLGLHEMAHALAYVNFTANEGEDDHFKNRFKTFSKTGRKIFNAMQTGKTNLLGSYAATNYHEFWAVSVENFFERPQALQMELPDLYRELVILLNQDPLSGSSMQKLIERA